MVGEYAVVFGYQGIALPAENRINISFTESQNNESSTILWNDDTTNDHWREYAKKVADCIEEKTGKHGVYDITNQIPLGRGMGSSTAIVIAMTKASVGDDEKTAKDIEDTVNPGNSGLDFTVIWNEKSVLFKKGDVPTFIDLPSDLLKNATLIDTGARSESTAELVAWVKNKYSHQKASTTLPAVGTPRPSSEEVATQDAIAVIGGCAERILKGEPLKDIIKDHHRAQVALGVVPKKTEEIIAEIEANGGYAKVLGAGGRTGGGGMVLNLR